MIKISQKGDFSKVSKFFKKEANINLRKIVEKHCSYAVTRLSEATPVDSGLTASSWSYEILNRNGGMQINFTNSNIQNGVPIAIILQYGHLTGTGGWVEGVDYINPTLKPIFQKISDDIWEEMRSNK